MTELGATLGAEWGSFWVIGTVAVANVVLGVWRPRFSKKRRTGASLGPTDTGELEETGEAYITGRNARSVAD